MDTTITAPPQQQIVLFSQPNITLYHLVNPLLPIKKQAEKIIPGHGRRYPRNSCEKHNLHIFLTELAIDPTSFASASFGIRIPANPRQASNRMAWHVYILRNERNALYTGVALNPIARYKEHLEGGKKAAKYTRSATSLELVYSVEADSKSDAYKIESAIKRLRKDRKEHIITAQPDLAELKGVFLMKRPDPRHGDSTS